MKKTTKWLLSLITVALLIFGLSVLEEHRFAQGMLYSVLAKERDPGHRGGFDESFKRLHRPLLAGAGRLHGAGRVHATAILTIPTAKLEGVYYMDGISSAILGIPDVSGRRAGVAAGGLPLSGADRGRPGGGGVRRADWPSDPSGSRATTWPSRPWASPRSCAR